MRTYVKKDLLVELKKQASHAKKCANQCGPTKGGRERRNLWLNAHDHLLSAIENVSLIPKKP